MWLGSSAEQPKAPRAVDEIGELRSPSGDDILSSRNLEQDTYPLVCS